MPIYEYGCLDCRKRSSLFVRSMNTAVKATCEHCGSKRVRRLISRVARVRPSSGGSMDDFDESMFNDVDENDPRSMAKFARRMQDEMGEEMGPEFDQMIEQMEGGEMPEDDAFGDLV